MAEPRIPIELLIEGKIKEWNAWRQENYDVETNLLDLKGVNLSKAELSKVNLLEADLSEADLSGTNLSEADLSEADLSRTNLSEADLSWTKLSGANMSEAILFRADLSGAILSGANLSEANFRLSICRNARFINCNLTGIQVYDWVVTDAVFEGGAIEYAYLTKEGKKGPKTHFKSVEEFAAYWATKRALEVLLPKIDPAFFPLLENNLKELDPDWLLQSVEFYREGKVKGTFVHPEIDKYEKRIKELEKLVRKTEDERNQALIALGKLVLSGSVPVEQRALVKRGSGDVGLALAGVMNILAEQVIMTTGSGPHQIINRQQIQTFNSFTLSTEFDRLFEQNKEEIKEIKDFLIDLRKLIEQNFPDQTFSADIVAQKVAEELGKKYDLPKEKGKFAKFGEWFKDIGCSALGSIFAELLKPYILIPK